MKPADLALIAIPGAPAIAADGSVVVAVASPDLEANLYRGTLLRLPAGGGDPVSLTFGPRDSNPVVSPDGSQVIFRRAPEKGPAQLFVLPLSGGEPRRLTDHPLGAGEPVFSPDGRQIAYLAAVPEPGRYGTDESITADAEPPRRITRLTYRADDEGFVFDRPKQLFVLDLEPAGQPAAEQQVAQPKQLTDEPSGVADPVFAPDGRLLYVRKAGVDQLADEIAVIAVSNVGAPGLGRTLIAAEGSASSLAVAGEQVYYLGAQFSGIDAVGRTNGLWAVPLGGGPPRRLTDEETVHVEPAAGRPIVVGEQILVGVLDRGAVTLLAVPVDAQPRPLESLTVLLGGQRVLHSFTVRGADVVAVVADGGSPGELVGVELDSSGSAGSETPLSDFGRPLLGAGIRPATELVATAPDGYPVHGWLVAPEGPGPHPVLLVVHGGPHAAYGPALFDEAQVYAAAGYVVVLGNPRGSAGYGQHHGRSVVGRLGTDDVVDLLALLDAALARPECDAARVGVMGGSYGGFMTTWLASHAPGRFVAAISERAVNAWDSFAGSSDIGYYFAEAYVGADREAQWRTSPLAYADRIELPFLIIHSEHDWRCPVEQAQRLFVSLRNRGAEVEMLLFPGEGHELSRTGKPRHRQQRFDAILAWWAKHLPI
ncbi:MAG: S9 family peptidase [Nakamurella sp.]